MLQRISIIITLFYILTCSTEPTGLMPTADFTISPDSGDTETIFIFDASVSTDTEGSATSLKFRWDWENDGIWDTNYLERTNVIHKFTNPGLCFIALEVKDSDGLTDKVVKQLSISAYQPDDYFPLNIGNIWMYSFSANYRDDIDQNSSKSNGTASLELLSIKNEENETKYYLNFEKEGQRIYRDLNISTGETSIDTSLISVKDTLIFIEDSTGVVRNVYPSSFFGFQLLRYADNEKDTIMYYANYSTYKLSKNIGIIHYSYDSYHNFVGSWGEWKLTDYLLQ